MEDIFGPEELSDVEELPDFHNPDLTPITASSSLEGRIKQSSDNAATIAAATAATQSPPSRQFALSSPSRSLASAPPKHRLSPISKPKSSPVRHRSKKRRNPSPKKQQSSVTDRKKKNNPNRNARNNTDKENSDSDPKPVELTAKPFPALSLPLQTSMCTTPGSASSPGLLTPSPLNTSNILKSASTTPDSSSEPADDSSGLRRSARLSTKRLTDGLYSDNLYAHGQRKEREVIVTHVQSRRRRQIAASKKKRRRQVEEDDVMESKRLKTVDTVTDFQNGKEGTQGQSFNHLGNYDENNNENNNHLANPALVCENQLKSDNIHTNNNGNEEVEDASEKSVSEFLRQLAYEGSFPFKLDTRARLRLLAPDPSDSEADVEQQSEPTSSVNSSSTMNGSDTTDRHLSQHEKDVSVRFSNDDVNISDKSNINARTADNDHRSARNTKKKSAVTNTDKTQASSASTALPSCNRPMDNMVDDVDYDKENGIERRRPRMKIVVEALRNDDNDKNIDLKNNCFTSALADARRKDYAERLFRTLEDDELSSLRRAFVHWYPAPPSNLQAAARYEAHFRRYMTPQMAKLLWNVFLKQWSDTWWTFYASFNDEARHRKQAFPRHRKPRITDPCARRWAADFHAAHGDARPDPHVCHVGDVDNDAHVKQRQEQQQQQQQRQSSPSDDDVVNNDKVAVNVDNRADDDDDEDDDLLTRFHHEFGCEVARVVDVVAPLASATSASQ